MALSLGSNTAIPGVRTYIPIVGGGDDLPYAATPNATLSVLKEMTPGGQIIYTLSGIWSATGAQTVTLRDRTGSYTATVTVTVATAPSLSGAPGSATVGSAYSFQPVLAGGLGNGVWRIASGSLPDGLSMNPRTGVISGTPSSGSATGAATITYADLSGMTTPLSVPIAVTGGAAFGFETLSVPASIPTQVAITGLLAGETVTSVVGAQAGANGTSVVVLTSGTQSVTITTSANRTFTASLGGGGVTPVAFANFPKIKAKRAASQRAIIAMLGDSLFAGYGANSTTGGGAGANAGSSPNNNRSNYSAPAYIAAQLKAAGIPARSDAIFGSGGVTNNVVADFNAANPVFQLGNGALISTQPETMGGPMIRTDVGGTSVGVFTPQELTDKIEITFITGTTTQILTATDSDGTIGTYDVGSSSGGGIRKITISRSVPSVKPITITQGSAVSGCYFLSLVPYNSQAPMVEVHNWGRGGWKVSDALVSTNLWSPANMIATYNPDAVVISLGANDANAAVSASTFQSNLQSLVTLASPSTRDVRLVKQHGSTTGGETGYDAPAAYRTAIDAIAASNSLRPAYNFHDGIILNPADYFDGIHLTRGGYSKEATVVSADMLVLG